MDAEALGVLLDGPERWTATYRWHQTMIASARGSGHPAVAYLVRLHADIGGRIQANKAEAERLAAERSRLRGF